MWSCRTSNLQAWTLVLPSAQFCLLSHQEMQSNWTLDTGKIVLGCCAPFERLFLSANVCFRCCARFCTCLAVWKAFSMRYPTSLFNVRAGTCAATWCAKDFKSLLLPSEFWSHFQNAVVTKLSRRVASYSVPSRLTPFLLLTFCTTLRFCSSLPSYAETQRALFEHT